MTELATRRVLSRSYRAVVSENDWPLGVTFKLRNDGRVPAVVEAVTDVAQLRYLGGAHDDAWGPA